MTLHHYQSQLADAANAGDGFARGNLDGDVQVAKAPIRDQVVLEWEAHCEPRLTPTHDVVGQAVASFFTRDGGEVYLTQDMIADVCRLSRSTVCKAIKDLVSVGRFRKRDLPTIEGNRGEAYRLTGEDTGWVPPAIGIAGRVTASEFTQIRRIQELETALRYFAGRYGGDHDFPDTVLVTLNNLSDDPEEIKRSEEFRKLDLENEAPTTVLSKTVNTALADRPKRSASQDQLNLIIMNQERTGLQDDDILASWPEIDRYSPVPAGLDPSLMTSLQANRTIQWLKRQQDAPVELSREAPERERVCTCPDTDQAAAPVAEVEEAAEEAWRATLAQLEMQLPRNTFDTWLKDTVGLVFDGMDLVVQVPSVVNIAWLEQRMYQTILRALRHSSGELLDIRFQVPAELGKCDMHPNGRRAPDMSARDVWEAALGELEMVLGRDIFDACQLQETEGVAFEGIDLVVQVPRKQAGMLDGPLRKPILEALRRCSGENLGVQLTFLAETPASEDES